MKTAEHIRLDEARERKVDWKKWGPYLSERQWGTVREDYSENGDAWNYFTHDQARSRAYRWGEDGIAGISDDKQRLCFALALWNGKDPILKERLFGLDQQRGQPRRRRQGGLLLPRQHAHPLVLDEHNSNPLHHGYLQKRNSEWFHMLNEDIISMPDKWEYPWYAAWDLAFHALPLSIVDPDFAKNQMEMMLRGAYLHPNGQMPAYEWNFSDVNPPVHAFATLFLYRSELAQRGEPDLDFLRGTFNKLLLNFTWWVNRKDRFGKNVFEGGFLGLDNIGVFDRSAPLPTGGHLEQADGTAWMALFSENMLELAIELAAHDPVYESMVFKFVEHFYYIAAAMNQPGQGGMWDEEDGFYYDVLRFPDGSATRLKVRSLVGLLPLCATTVIEKAQREQIPSAISYMQERMRRIPELLATIHPTTEGHLGMAERGILALVNPERLRRILGKCSTRTSSWGPTASARSRSSTSGTRMFFIWTARSTGWTTCRRNRTRACSAATPTGGARSGCR